MAPSEIASLREQIAALERRLLEALGDIRADLGAISATQIDHDRRLREHSTRFGVVDDRCAKSQERRSSLEATGQHQAAELARLAGGATHWSRWAVGAVVGLLAWALATAIGVAFAAKLLG